MTIGRVSVHPRDVATVLALYCASTLLYALLGVEFDATTLTQAIQFIDTKLLAEQMLESIWYYHANPPLLNTLVGIAGKLFGSHKIAFLSVCFHIFGLLTILTVYALTLKLSTSRAAAAAASGLLAFNPDFVLYQNWLMYTFPAVTLLTLSAYALHRYVETRATRWCFTFFALLAALLLTRSLFHLSWLVLIVALLVFVLRTNERQIVLAAALPVLLVAFWYGKNLYYFGSFSSSTWMGLGLTNITTLMVPRPELTQLVERGDVSPLALVSRYEQEPLLFPPLQEPTGIPVLDEMKTSAGLFNYNYRPLIDISRAYTGDALRVIHLRPRDYMAGVSLANQLFFSPSNVNIYFSARNKAAVQGMQRVLVPLLYGVDAAPEVIEDPHFGFTGKYGLEVDTSPSLIAMWLIGLTYAGVQAGRGLRASNRATQARAIVLGFIVVTALYVYTVSTTLEMAQNYRYRFLTEPLIFVLTATAATALLETCLALRADRRIPA